MLSFMTPLFGILDFGTTELIVIGAIAVMLYGKNLPEAGRSIGRQLRDFRSGFRGIEEEIRSTTRSLGLPTTKFSSALSTLDALTKPSSSAPSTINTPTKAVSEALSDLEEPTAPKFEPPPTRS
jgi:sec-independent protein translocase protein TatA